MLSALADTWLMSNEQITEQIAAVLRSESPDLGITQTQAQALRDAIIDADLCDNDALQAYDLLHNLTTFGRAF